MTTSAEIAVERRDAAIVARLSGEVDMTNSQYVGNELASSVPNEAATLVVDLSQARYLDSAAIELLFDLARRLRRRRQALRLVLPPTSPLKRVLELTEIGAVAPVHESLDEALAPPEPPL
ncbi:MAG: STAS domain-containing protein [Thermoleophilaceae bacterium]